VNRGTARTARLAQVLVAAAALLRAGSAQAQDRGAPPPEPAPDAAPAAQDAGRAAQDAGRAAQEAPPAPVVTDKVNVRRLADVVAVREGPRAAERVMYYFNPDLLLSQGDHVEQGSGGQSDLTLPGGARIQLHASAHLELALVSPEGDVVRFPLLTRLDASALERPLTLILPGGTQLRMQNTSLDVHVDPGRMRVRNTGSGPVNVTGDLRLQPGHEGDETAGRLELQRGEEVLIPLFRVSSSQVGTVTDLWGLLTVRHQRGLRLSPEGGVLRLERDAGDVSAAGDAPVAVVEEAVVGGVTTRWLPGSTLVIRNPRHIEAPPAASDETPDVLPTQPADAPPPPDGAQPGQGV
jgi:hypothetical protein